MESCSREEVGDATGRWWSDSTEVLVLEEADQLPEEEWVPSSLVPALKEGHAAIIKSNLFHWGFPSPDIFEPNLYLKSFSHHHCHYHLQAFQEMASRESNKYRTEQMHWYFEKWQCINYQSNTIKIIAPKLIL